MRKPDYYTLPSKPAVIPFFFLLLLFCGTILPLTTAKAGLNPYLSNACDRDYWQSLHYKAWEQAQREIEANVFFIWKPDSVLELTCFDTFGKHAASHLGKLFSDIDRDDALGDALTDAVGAPLGKFTKNNYGYDLGGDHMDGTKIDLTTNLHNGGYVDCAYMYKLWAFYMCQNHENQSYFMSFQDLVDHENDLRDYPKDLKCSAASHDTPNHWKMANFVSTSMTARADSLYGSEFFDPIVNYYEVTEPVGTPFFKDCNSGKILTGVEVISSDGNYPEIFCANPGCHPDKQGKNCVQ